MIPPNEENTSVTFPITTPSAADATSNISAPFFVLVKNITSEATTTTRAPMPVAIIAPFTDRNPNTNVFAPATAPLNIVIKPPDMRSRPPDI